VRLPTPVQRFAALRQAPWPGRQDRLRRTVSAHGPAGEEPLSHAGLPDAGRPLPDAGVAGVPEAAVRAPVAVGDAIEEADGAGGGAGATRGGGGAPGERDREARVGSP